MKNPKLLCSLLAALSLGVTFVPLSPGQAQDPPATTYQPGFWQPVARVDPKRQLSMQIVNQSGYLLEYGLTEDRGFTRIPAGQTGRVYAKPVPMYLVIYPVQANRAVLKFDVTVTGDNQVIITVRQAPPGSERNSSVDIDRTGAVYVS